VSWVVWSDVFALMFACSKDYIRVFTKDGLGTVGCNPPDYPTAEYIAAHENAYTKYVLLGEIRRECFC
jgi:hypothetical protein